MIARLVGPEQGKTAMFTPGFQAASVVTCVTTKEFLPTPRTFQLCYANCSGEASQPGGHENSHKRRLEPSAFLPLKKQ